MSQRNIRSALMHVGLVGAAAAHLAFLPAYAARTKPPNVASIVRRASEATWTGKDFAVDVALRTTSPKGSPPERNAAFTLVAGEKNSTLFLRRAPKLLQGSMFLVAGGKHWTITAGSSSALELTEGQVVFGEIVAADLSRLDLTEGWSAKLLGEENFEETPCYKIELTRPPEIGVFDRIVGWFAKKGSLPLRFDFFGSEPERRLRMARFEDYKKGALGLRPGRIVFEGGNSWEDVYTATFTNPRRIDTTPIQFTPEGILPVRDAVRPKTPSKNAPEVSIEQVLEVLAPRKKL